MTSPIGTVLRHLGDASDPHLLPAPDAVRNRGERRRRRMSRSISAGALVACSVLVGVLASLDTSAPVTQPADPAPSPTSSPQAEGPDVEPPWHRIGTGAHRFSARAIAARDGRFVVVGDSSDFEDEGPAVYWSDDGVDWKAPPPGTEPDSVNVTDVIAVRDGFLAVGVGVGGGPAAWRSVDGRTWVESPVATPGDGGTGALWGITGTRLGYYAWGFHRGSAHLWRSADGTAWAPVADEAAFDLPQSETICTVRDVEGGLQATGVVAPPRTREGQRVVWTSVDGEQWFLDDATGAPTFWCDPTQELGHWEARTEAGQARIEPYGSGDVVEFLTATQ
jgi:hypothetical protein